VHYAQKDALHEDALKCLSYVTYEFVVFITSEFSS